MRSIVRHLSLMLCAKFDGNLLTTFEVMVKKLLTYFFVNKDINWHLLTHSLTYLHDQWRCQLVARAPWRMRNFFRYTLKQVVWFGLVLCQTLNLALFVQPYSLWNDTITGYNGACAKVNVVFTARRYALAHSFLSSGVRPSVCLSRSCIVSRRLKILSNIFLGPVSPSF